MESCECSVCSGGGHAGRMHVVILVHALQDMYHVSQHARRQQNGPMIQGILRNCHPVRTQGPGALADKDAARLVMLYALRFESEGPRCAV